jgi:hypothetical protein
MDVGSPLVLASTAADQERRFSEQDMGFLVWMIGVCGWGLLPEPWQWRTGWVRQHGGRMKWGVRTPRARRWPARTPQPVRLEWNCLLTDELRADEDRRADGKTRAPALRCAGVALQNREEQIWNPGRD